MNILIYTTVYYPDIIGGGEFSLKLVTEGLINRGHKITVHCLGLKDREEWINGVHIFRHYYKKISESEISRTRNHEEIRDPLNKFEKIYYRRKDIIYNKKIYYQYKALISEGKFDLVHSATALNFLGRYNLWKAAYDLNVPISHVARSPQLLELDILHGFMTPLYKFLVRKSSKFLSGFTAPSMFMIEQHKDIGINCRIMYPIYNALDLQPISVNTEEIISKKNMIIYAGDLRKEKGIFTLYTACNIFIDKADLIYIGSGKDENVLKKYEGITVIKWLAKKELYSLMRKAKVVVLPSEWDEAFGRTIIEGIANGTISIGSNRGGIPEILENDERYIFRAGDYIGLRKLIYRIMNLSSDEYKNEINKLQKRLDRFSIDKYINEWELFFKKQVK